jgi:calcineurin-like phosphoesterase family protein
MGNVFFVSDTHFSHSNIIKYCNRPFNNAHEMDEAIITNWNSVVGQQDTVYHCGDFAFCKTSADVEKYIRRLNGHIFLVRGNHDKDAVAKANGFAWVSGRHQGKMIEVEGQSIFLFHTSCRVWDKSHHGSWCLFGHSHGSLPDDPNSLSLDVGVEAWNYTPVSFEQIKARMSQKTWKPMDCHG